MLYEVEAEEYKELIEEKTELTEKYRLYEEIKKKREIVNKSSVIEVGGVNFSYKFPTNTVDAILKLSSILRDISKNAQFLFGEGSFKLDE